MAAIDLVGICLPANVMLPNSSSTLYLGNRLSMSDGKSISADGEVMRMQLGDDGNIHIDIGDPAKPEQKQGRAVLFASGMVALKKPELKK